MSVDRPLPSSALCRRCDPGPWRSPTTADLADVPGIIGQERAEEAVRFAIGIRRYGYNLFALGTSGMGKHGFVRAFLERRAASEKAPSDWAYVHNFADPRRPRALRLPPGRAPSSARTCGGWWRSCAPPSPPCSRARTTARERSSSRPGSPSRARRPSAAWRSEPARGGWPS